MREVERAGPLEPEVPHLAAAFQDAVVDVLATKTLRAVKEMDCRRIVLGGGVANSRALRAELTRRLGGRGAVYAPSPRLSTDNAAMIARAALMVRESHPGGGGARRTRPQRPDSDPAPA